MDKNSLTEINKEGISVDHDIGKGWGNVEGEEGKREGEEFCPPPSTIDYLSINFSLLPPYPHRNGIPAQVFLPRPQKSSKRTNVFTQRLKRECLSARATGPSGVCSVIRRKNL